jgi:Reverse transcriptase (RNA-dependent DNA polymerase).
VRIGNYLSVSFLIDNSVKQGDALSPLLFNFTLGYAIRKVKETRLGLDMNNTHQVLAYADVLNLIGDYIRTIERNADVLINACKNIGSAVNTGKKREIGRHQGMIANKNIRIGKN